MSDILLLLPLSIVRILYFNNGYVRSSNNIHNYTITIYNRIVERKTSTTKQQHTDFPLGNPNREEKPTNLLSIDSSISTMSSSTIQELKSRSHKDPENNKNRIR